jgi:hypothetical protein
MLENMAEIVKVSDRTLIQRVFRAGVMARR